MDDYGGTMRGENIKATLRHDAGAFAQCSYCGRYSDYYQLLIRYKEYRCDCGKKEGWSGSFKPPTEQSRWSGPEGLALFPEILKPELREIRSTIRDSHTKKDLA